MGLFAVVLFVLLPTGCDPPSGLHVPPSLPVTASTTIEVFCSFADFLLVYVVMDDCAGNKRLVSVLALYL